MIGLDLAKSIMSSTYSMMLLGNQHLLHEPAVSFLLCFLSTEKKRNWTQTKLSSLACAPRASAGSLQVLPERKDTCIRQPRSVCRWEWERHKLQPGSWCDPAFTSRWLQLAPADWQRFIRRFILMNESVRRWTHQLFWTRPPADWQCNQLGNWPQPSGKPIAFTKRITHDVNGRCLLSERLCEDWIS